MPDWSCVFSLTHNHRFVASSSCGRSLRSVKRQPTMRLVSWWLVTFLRRPVRESSGYLLLCSAGSCISWDIRGGSSSRTVPSSHLLVSSIDPPKARWLRTLLTLNATLKVSPRRGWCQDRRHLVPLSIGQYHGCFPHVNHITDEVSQLSSS